MNTVETPSQDFPQSSIFFSPITPSVSVFFFYFLVTKSFNCICQWEVMLYYDDTRWIFCILMPANQIIDSNADRGFGRQGNAEPSNLTLD